MISIIVPVKNGLNYTRAFVDSVRATNPGAAIEWVIVDSGSTDGTLEYCAEIGARVVPFYRQPFNYCAAVNVGAAHAAGDLWIIANNDLEFRSPDILATVERLFREWPLLAVLSPGREEGDAELEFVYARLYGASWAVRPSAFREWGGMPETLSGYGYDEDFTAVQCWRRGYGNAWLNGWRVLHHGSVTFGPLAGNTTPVMRRNLQRLIETLGAEAVSAKGSLRAVRARVQQFERERSPCRLLVRGLSRVELQRQGYANARLWKDDGVPPVAPVAVAERGRERACQWLPWLANELWLQPDAPIVGGHGYYAVRDHSLLGQEISEWRRLARCVGPEPYPLLPYLPERGPTLREWAIHVRHTWRNRKVKLPEEW